MVQPKLSRLISGESFTAYKTNFDIIHHLLLISAAWTLGPVVIHLLSFDQRPFLSRLCSSSSGEGGGRDFNLI